MLGRRPAAAAHDAHAVLADERRVRLRQPLRRQVVDRLPVLHARQPGVGRAEQRERRVLRQEAQRLMHQLRPGRAVQPHAGQPERRERRQRRPDLAAHQHLPRRLDRHCREDRRLQPPLRQRVAARQNRRLALQQVVDGLHQQRVHPAVEQPPRLREIGRMQLVEADLPQTGQLRPGPDRADRKARRTRTRKLSSRLARQIGRGLVDLIRALAKLVLRQSDRRPPERVGQHRVRARCEVRGVQLPHRLRAADVEHLVAALKPVEVRKRQIHHLNTSARSAIKHDSALGGNIQQLRSVHSHNLTDTRPTALPIPARDPSGLSPIAAETLPASPPIPQGPLPTSPHILGETERGAAAVRNRPPTQGGCPLLADWGVGAEPEHSTTRVSQRTPSWGETEREAAAVRNRPPTQGAVRF